MGTENPRDGEVQVTSHVRLGQQGTNCTIGKAIEALLKRTPFVKGDHVSKE